MTEKRGCGILFYKRNPDRVLVYRRDNMPDLPFAGCLDLLGGHIEHGESAEEAMQREAKEELFDRRSEKPFALKDFTLFRAYTDKYGYEQHIYYTAADFDIGDVELREGKELVWITEEELKKEELGFDFTPLVQAFFTFLKQNRTI
jgi:8-oxo-dGTP diphosphatase